MYILFYAEDTCGFTNKLLKKQSGNKKKQGYTPQRGFH